MLLLVLKETSLSLKEASGHFVHQSLDQLFKAATYLGKFFSLSIF